ncbi:hypothetical protein CHU98_g3446 [Xylaria longipes]|nr:hypothetical protein CHU98_g3446 [Xylaria longipes]
MAVFLHDCFRNTRPYFVESNTAVATIIRLRRRENDVALSVTLQSLEPGLRLWLNRLGFRDTDIGKLEEVCGGIVQGIMILLHILPRREERGKLPSGPLPNLLGFPVQGQVNHRKFTKLGDVSIKAVKALFQDVRQSTEIDYQRHTRASQPQGFEPKILLPQPEGLSETLDDPNREWDAKDLQWAASEMQPLLDSSASSTKIDSNTTLFRVQRLTSVTDWSKQSQTSMLYEYNLQAMSANVRNIKLCHVQLIIPPEWPNLYAIDATQEDPASRLAIKLTPPTDSHNDILGPYYHTTSDIRTTKSKC